MNGQHSNSSQEGENRVSALKSIGSIPLAEVKPISDEELAALFSRGQQISKEINDKLGEAFEKSGYSRKQIESYVNDPRNYTAEQWQIFEVSRGDWEVRLYHLLGKEYKKKRKQAIEDKITKERRGKTLGARKNWMPMR